MVVQEFFQIRTGVLQRPTQLKQFLEVSPCKDTLIDLLQLLQIFIKIIKRVSLRNHCLVWLVEPVVKLCKGKVCRWQFAISFYFHKYACIVLFSCTRLDLWKILQSLFFVKLVCLELINFRVSNIFSFVQVHSVDLTLKKSPRILVVLLEILKVRFSNQTTFFQLGKLLHQLLYLEILNLIRSDIGLIAVVPILV